VERRNNRSIRKNTKRCQDTRVFLGESGGLRILLFKFSGEVERRTAPSRALLLTCIFQKPSPMSPLLPFTVRPDEVEQL
jgi:hypothetical protein